MDRRVVKWRPPDAPATAIAGGLALLLVLPAMYLLFTVFAHPVPEEAK